MSIKIKLNPVDDGITHINIYSKSSTWIGRELSNFAYSPINTEDGAFQSIEGYWYFLLTGDERLRKLFGYDAKKYGQSLNFLSNISENDDVFITKIKKALTIKLESNQRLKKELLNCKLKLEHYYYFGDIKNKPKVIDAGYKWIIDFFEQYREQNLK